MTAGDDGTAIVRNAKTLRLIARTSSDDVTLHDAALSPDARQLVVARDDGWAAVYDVRKGSFEHWLHANPTQPHSAAHDPGTWVTGVAWSRDGRFVATTGIDSTARIWNPRTGRLLRTMTAPGVLLFTPALTRDGNFLVAAGIDGNARVWDLRSRSRPTILSQPEAIYAADFSPNGQLVATGSVSGTTRVWDWRRRIVLATMPRHADLVNAVHFSPDGHWIMSASDDGTAKIYTCTTCVPLDELVARAHRRERLIQGASGPEGTGVSR